VRDGGEFRNAWAAGSSSYCALGPLLLVQFGVDKDEAEGAWIGFAMGDAEAATGTAFFVENRHALDHSNGLNVAGAAEGAGVAEDSLRVQALIEIEGDFCDRRDRDVFLLVECSAGAGLDAGHVFAPVAGGGGGVEEGGAFHRSKGGAKLSDDGVGAGLGAGMASFTGREEGLFLGERSGGADKGGRLLVLLRIAQGAPNFAGKVTEAKFEKLAAVESWHGLGGERKSSGYLTCAKGTPDCDC
jgi:hypothetical protein